MLMFNPYRKVYKVSVDPNIRNIMLEDKQKLPIGEQRSLSDRIDELYKVMDNKFGFYTAFIPGIEILEARMMNSIFERMYQRSIKDRPDLQRPIFERRANAVLNYTYAVLLDTAKLGVWTALGLTSYGLAKQLLQ